jgi:non-specific protein-tyrosine kinase
MKFEIALEKAKKLKLVEGNILDNPDLDRQKLMQSSAPVYRFCKHRKLNLNEVNKRIWLGLKANAPEMDCYRILRTQILQRTRSKGRNTIMITSILPGEGKTLTAINLALSFAKTQNYTALLVDSDLRRQHVHKYLGLKNDIGLGDFLNKSHSLHELFVWPSVEKFTFISGGNTIVDSSELLGSVRMQILVEDLKKRYLDRYIFFDSAPLLGGDDALTLSSWIDAIIIVVESHKTPMKQVEEALDLIPKEKFLGFVLNKHKTYSNKHNKYYNRSVSTKFSKQMTRASLKLKKKGKI